MRTYLLSGSRVPNKDVAGPAYSSTQLPSTVLWSATAGYAHRDNTLKEEMTRAKRTITHYAPFRCRLPWPGSPGSCRVAAAGARPTLPAPGHGISPGRLAVL